MASVMTIQALTFPDASRTPSTCPDAATGSRESVQEEEEEETLEDDGEGPHREGAGYMRGGAGELGHAQTPDHTQTPDNTQTTQTPDPTQTTFQTPLPMLAGTWWKCHKCSGWKMGWHKKPCGRPCLGTPPPERISITCDHCKRSGTNHSKRGPLGPDGQSWCRAHRGPVSGRQSRFRNIPNGTYCRSCATFFLRHQRLPDKFPDTEGFHGDGSDPHAVTNTAGVLRRRQELIAWCGPRCQGKPSRTDFENWKKSLDPSLFKNTGTIMRFFYNSGRSKWAEEMMALDSRLDLFRLGLTWGLTREDLASSSNKPKQAPILQKLVRRYPHVLTAPSQGSSWFRPITQETVDEAHERTWYKESLSTLIFHRIVGSMQADQKGLIIGTRLATQPTGRYIYGLDIISKWNESAGFCCQQFDDDNVCGRPIYLQHTEAADGTHEDVCHDPYCSGLSSHAACIQRIKGDHIHLAANCQRGLVCFSCSSVFESDSRHRGQ